MSYFSDPEAVARYAEGPVRQVPGFLGLLQMAGILLAERAPDDAHVLVLGAGGGLELKAFAETQPGWRFCGVDPSAEMLGLAGRTLGPLASRVDLHEGYIDGAPGGPFDAATCILTLHFIPEEERRRTLAEVHRRLKPGAPFVVAHHSFPRARGRRPGGCPATLLLRWHRAYRPAMRRTRSRRSANACRCCRRSRTKPCCEMQASPTSPFSMRGSRSGAGSPTGRNRRGLRSTFFRSANGENACEFKHSL